AETEPRHFASILFVNVETKRSIPLHEPRLPYPARPTLIPRARNPSPPAPAIRARHPGLSPGPVSRASRIGRVMGRYGIAWVLMGVNGAHVGAVDDAGAAPAAGAMTVAANGWRAGAFSLPSMLAGRVPNASVLWTRCCPADAPANPARPLQMVAIAAEGDRRGLRSSSVSWWAARAQRSSRAGAAEGRAPGTNG